MANPDTRAKTDPTAVEVSGRRFASPQSVHLVPRASERNVGMGSVGPATLYPEYSITVGQGLDAEQVSPKGYRTVAASLMPSLTAM